MLSRVQCSAKWTRWRCSWRRSYRHPDARHIGDSLVARGIKLSLGGTIYDPADPLGKMFFNILATLGCR